MVTYFTGRGKCTGILLDKRTITYIVLDKGTLESSSEPRTALSGEAKLEQGIMKVGDTRDHKADEQVADLQTRRCWSV